MAKPNTESRFVELRRKFQAWLTQSAPSGVMRLDLQVLEDRVLYSATPLPVDAAESIDANLDHLDSSMQAVVADPYAPQPDSSANGAPAPSTDASNSSLIASLDASLADLDLLLAQQDPASDSDDHSIDVMWPDAPSSESSSSDVPSIDVPTSPDHLRHEVIFVQSTLYDLDRLTADLFDGDTQDRVLHVIALDQSVSGFEQIDATLAQYSNLDAIHFVTHGTDGFVQLGGSWLTYWNIDAHAADLQRWGMALHENGDILIYGCDVAASQTGQNMLDSIALFTQADVAASTDSTGSIARGGNWDLEWSSGEIETNLAFSSELQNSYESLWATYTVTSSSGGTGAGTLRAAITNANSNPGFDTIVFNIGTGVQTINLSGAIANITGAVFIDGTTQGGYSNTPLIVVNGGGSIQDGFRLYSGSAGSTIRGLVIQNFTQDGIDIYQSNGNTIVGNYIGITQAGTAAAGN
ncbi:MAG: DUF4347 domain-containing protein, partial [Planctomycetales bacterium]|nr:DUF4347 domain-containing protein [Planctomycetales bacterium]